MMVKPPDLIGSTEAAQALGIDKSTLTRRVQRGEIAAYSVGNALAFDRATIERLAVDRVAAASKRGESCC